MSLGVSDSVSDFGKQGEIALADVQVPAERPSWADQRVSFWSGDVSDPAWTESLVDRDDISVFHLASIVSSHAETDLDLALRVNIDGARSILNAVRRRAGATRFVATSTFATFGGELPPVCTDLTKQTPQSTYGVTKVLLELLVNDYTRRGLIDGELLRNNQALAQRPFALNTLFWGPAKNAPNLVVTNGQAAPKLRYVRVVGNQSLTKR